MMTAEAPISGRLRFDPVITWGHVLLFVGFVGGGLGVWFATEIRATTFDYRISSLENIAEETKGANRELLNELKSLNRELVDIRIKIVSRNAREGS